MLHYLVVTELCHPRGEKHSWDFWRLVEGAIPDFRLRRSALRGIGAPFDHSSGVCRLNQPIMDMGGMAATLEKEANADQMFLMMMIPHHATAITMGTQESERGEDQELEAMAKKIVAAQAEEIGIMGSCCPRACGRLLVGWPSVGPGGLCRSRGHRAGARAEPVSLPITQSGRG